MAWTRAARLLEDETGDRFWKAIDASGVEVCAIISEVGTVLKNFKQLNRLYDELSTIQVDSVEWVQREQDLDAQDLLRDLEQYKLE